MNNHSIYADYNANCPIRDCALRAMNDAYLIAGNSSSIHKNGQKLRRIVENSRKSINSYLGNVSGETIFTSGATEACQLAIESAIDMGFENIFLSAIEHDAIYQYAKLKFKNISIIPCTENGIIDIKWLEVNISQFQKPLVILMAINNETGILQPISQASNLARINGGAIIIDAVQALGKIPPQDYVGYADWLILSGHKIGGPIGVGALIMAAGIQGSFARPGGGQEKGLRAGTLNAPAIAGFASAIEETANENNDKIKAIRDDFETKLKSQFPNLIIFGENTKRAYNTTCFAIYGQSAEHLVISLDLENISISSGSACSSGSTKISRAIKAMNIGDDIARGALRISFGYKSKAQDVDFIIDALKKAVNRGKAAA